MVTIEQVMTKAQLRRFVDFPLQLYQDNPYYVPDLRSDERNDLNPKRNPAYEHGEAAQWLALRQGRVVGRIMALINHNVNRTWNKRQARFSRLDFIDDAEVADALLGQAEAWAIQRGMVELVGPMGFCDFDKEGVLVEGFEELSTFATYYNHAYYKDHLERLGYAKEVDWLEYQLTVPDRPDEKLTRICKMITERTGYKLLEFNRSKDILPYGKAIFGLLNESYKDLYGFVPLTDKQVQLFINKFFGFVNPRFIKAVVDKQGALAAIGITMPSLSKALQRNKGRLFPFGFLPVLRSIKKNNVLDMYLVAVKPEYQNLGLNALLIDAILREAIDQGYRLGESNPELEDNEKVKAFWKHFQRRQHRRRRVYAKHMGNT